ncbi:MAG: SPOR domain-containing protein [Alphaproteobacteria bacterium]
MSKLFLFFLVFTLSFSPFYDSFADEVTQAAAAPLSRRDIFLKRLVNAAKGKDSSRPAVSPVQPVLDPDNKFSGEPAPSALKDADSAASVSVDEELKKLKDEISLLKKGKINALSDASLEALSVPEGALTKDQKKASTHAVHALQEELAAFQGEDKVLQKGSLTDGISSIKSEISAIRNELSRTGDLKGIFVQAGAYENRKSALGVIENLVRLGRVFISPIIKDGALLYRVRVGSLETQEIAESVRVDVVKAGYADARIVESK